MRNRDMSEKRQWDENRSPQWKYMFQKDSVGKRNTRRKREREENEKRIEEENEYTNMNTSSLNGGTKNTDQKSTGKKRIKNKL